MAKYVEVAKQRIVDGIRKYGKIVEQAQKRGVNEADTRDIVKAILGDVLGYDPFFEVTGEYSVKGQYADFGVKVEDQIRFFVEVKSVGTKLEERQMFQVIGYAANQGHDWGVLTNGETWNVYKLFTGQERGTELVISVSLTDGEVPIKEKADRFFMFSKEGFRQNALSDYWTKAQVLSPMRIAEKLCEDIVLRTLRTELQRGSGFKISVETVYSVMMNQVIRGDLADKLKSDTSKSKSK